MNKKDTHWKVARRTAREATLADLRDGLIHRNRFQEDKRKVSDKRACRKGQW